MAVNITAVFFLFSAGKKTFFHELNPIDASRSLLTFGRQND